MLSCIKSHEVKMNTGKVVGSRKYITTIFICPWKSLKQRRMKMSAYEFFKIEICQVEEQVAQGSGGITVSGNV